MQDFRLERQNEPALVFTGELLAEKDSRFGGERKQERWTELRVYRTQGGKLVAQSVGRSKVHGEIDLHKAWVCDNEQDVIQALGHGRLAKLLYQELGIDDAERID